MIKFAKRLSPSPFCELDKWKQTCVCSRLDVSRCAQGQSVYSEGKRNHKMCCFRAAISFLVPFRHLRAPHSNSLVPWTAAYRRCPHPGASICLEDQSSTLSLAEGWWSSPAYQQHHPVFQHPPSLTQRELSLLRKREQSILLMPSVGGLALGDQNNCCLRSASQENNNASRVL